MHRTVILAALGMAFVATEAKADGQNVVFCQTDTDQAITCPFNLIKGQDYILGYGGSDDSLDANGVKVELINLAGEVTMTAVYSFGGPTTPAPNGGEFRAAYTATYQLRVTPSDVGANAWIDTDCRHDAKTMCSLSTDGRPQHGNSSGAALVDADWWRVALRKGKTYTVNATVDYVYRTTFTLLDATDKPLVGSRVHPGNKPVFRYTARASGVYYLSVAGGDGYTVSMR